jgi:hypothetical protein
MKIRNNCGISNKSEYSSIFKKLIIKDEKKKKREKRGNF